MVALKGMPSLMYSSTARNLSLYEYINYPLVVQDFICMPGGSILGQRQPSNQAWVSDITYIHKRSGSLYLAVVLDVYASKIVGWAMAPSIRAELVCAALHLAIA